MRCPSCGTENPQGMKFCGTCATALKNRCPRCGFENPPQFRFCGECAAPLAAEPSQSAAQAEPHPRGGTGGGVRVGPEQPVAEVVDGERKTVTALFADIKGSMDLMEELDPEEARGIVDPALQLMIDAVHRYGGYIVQSTGDGIFALFGAPIAHEDHPHRALYAALRIQDEMRRYADQRRREGGGPLHLRVGINTGEVVVRSIRKDDLH